MVFSVAVITGFRDKMPSDDSTIHREIISSVNLAEYNKRLTNRVRAAELKEQMEQRAAELQDVMLYETLAASDTKMMELLTQFKSLT